MIGIGIGIPYRSGNGGGGAAPPFLSYDFTDGAILFSDNPPTDPADVTDNVATATHPNGNLVQTNAPSQWVRSAQGVTSTAAKGAIYTDAIVADLVQDHTAAITFIPTSATEMVLIGYGPTSGSGFYYYSLLADGRVRIRVRNTSNSDIYNRIYPSLPAITLGAPRTMYFTHEGTTLTIGLEGVGTIVEDAAINLASWDMVATKLAVGNSVSAGGIGAGGIVGDIVGFEVASV